MNRGANNFMHWTVIDGSNSKRQGRKNIFKN